jgi:hypothetical protein
MPQITCYIFAEMMVFAGIYRKLPGSQASFYFSDGRNVF